MHEHCSKACEISLLSFITDTGELQYVLDIDELDKLSFIIEVVTSGLRSFRVQRFGPGGGSDLNPTFVNTFSLETQPI